MMSCIEDEIEIVGDKELERKQAKAERYASQPERFMPLSLELEMRSIHGNRLITYDEGKWSCSCDFFEKYETCSHVMATGRVLAALPIIQPRGNLEDTCEEFFMKDTNADLLTVSEVAKILRVDDTTVRRWVKQGALEAVILPHVNARQAYRIRRETLNSVLGTDI